MRLNLLWLIPVVALLSVGCSTATTTPTYDYSNLRASQPKSIVVIPPANNSVEINAPYIFLSTISKPLSEKGYYVFPVSVIDHFLKDNGLPTPFEMNNVPLDKIRENIGADAVLYVTIENWGQKFNIISSTAVVKSTLTLVDARNGDLLWEAKAYAEESSDGGDGSLLSAVLIAVVDQIAGSLSDNTPTLSRQANNRAINARDKGLLNGPYKIEQEP